MLNKKKLSKNIKTAALFSMLLSGSAFAAHGEDKSSKYKAKCQHQQFTTKWQPLAVNSESPHENVEIYQIMLGAPADPNFHDSMGGLPEQMSANTFHAAEGKMFVTPHSDGRTDISFEFQHLIPHGIYTLWDVINADIAGGNFADRPLANEITWGDDVRHQQLYGGVEAMGPHALRADRCGQATISVSLDHRPGVEFLLDYHANDRAKGGVKGQDIFPGALWAKFPDFD